MGWGFLQPDLVRGTQQLCPGNPGSMIGVWWPHLKFSCETSLSWFYKFQLSPNSRLPERIIQCDMPPTTLLQRMFLFLPVMEMYPQPNTARSAVLQRSTQLMQWKCPFYCVGRKLLGYSFTDYITSLGYQQAMSTIWGGLQENGVHVTSKKRQLGLPKREDQVFFSGIKFLKLICIPVVLRQKIKVFFIIKFSPN